MDTCEPYEDPAEELCRSTTVNEECLVVDHAKGF